MPQASYAIVEGKYNSQRADTFAVHVIRVPYDIERAIQQAAEEHMPELEAYAKELRTAQYRGSGCEESGVTDALRSPWCPPRPQQVSQRHRQHAITHARGRVSLGEATDLQECIAFLLIKGNTVLAEKRKLTKKVVPGVIALPGGHLEEGESPEEALLREVSEELGIVPTERYYVCTLLYRSQEGSICVSGS